MREIKFRAWCDREKIFYYFGFGDLYAVEDTVAIGKNPQTAKCLNHYQRGVNPRLTFQQYTGLHDKNGREIYEGDILGYWASACWLLDWDNQKAQYAFRYYNEPTLRKDEPILNHFAFRANQKECSKKEIIGNIYENPELLNHVDTTN